MYANNIAKVCQNYDFFLPALLLVKTLGLDNSVMIVATTIHLAPMDGACRCVVPLRQRWIENKLQFMIASDFLMQHSTYTVYKPL